MHVEVNDGRSNVKRSEKRLNYLTIGLRVLYDDQNLTIENCKAWRPIVKFLRKDCRISEDIEASRVKQPVRQNEEIRKVRAVAQGTKE